MPELTVECYAGYRGEQTPRAFTLGEQRIEVAQVLDQWLAPDHRYFKVEGHDGHLYILRHDTGADRWELTLFQRRDDSRIGRSNAAEQHGPKVPE